jgi:hypothetical protein
LKGIFLKIYVVEEKNLVIFIVFKDISCRAFSDEINFEKFKKVLKNLIEGVKIQTPVTLTFFMITPN